MGDDRQTSSLSAPLNGKNSFPADRPIPVQRRLHPNARLNKDTKSNGNIDQSEPMVAVKNGRNSYPTDKPVAVQRRPRPQTKLHHDIGKCERQLEENVETVRQQVQACFQRCRDRLEEREKLLLMQINDEYRKIRRSLMAPKRMAMVNNLNLNMDALIQAADGKSGGESGDVGFLIRQGHNRNAHNNKDTESEVPPNGENNGNETRTSPDGSPRTRVPPYENVMNGSPKTGVPPYENVVNGTTRQLDALQAALKQTETKQLHFTRANDSILANYDHIVSQLGMVYMGNADPSRTLATCYPALVLSESYTKIKGITIDGEECTTGGSNVHAVLRSMDGVATICNVTDSFNGTYKIAYVPPSVGLHELHVMISGQPIRNSPFEVFVKPVRLHVNKAFLGGQCTVDVEMPRDYMMPIMRDGKPNGTRKLNLQSIQIVILDPEGNELEGSMLGAVKRKGPICTYNVKYTPQIQGDHEIIITWVGQDEPITQQIIPVHEKEQMGSKGCRQGQFVNPTDVLVSVKGDIFVADTVENRRIQVFKPDGKFKRQFYVPLQEPGLLGANEHLMALLFLNSKTIMIFNHKGSLVNQFVAEDLSQPYGIAVDSKNHIYINDRGLHSIYIYDTTGKLVKRVGVYGGGPCQFDYPNYICMDLDDHVYISEARNNRIQELDSHGAYNREFRSGDKLKQPGAIVVTDSGYLVVHNESNGQVHIINLDDSTFKGSIHVDLIAVYTRRIAVTKNGFLLALDMTNHCLWRYRIPYKS